MIEILRFYYKKTLKNIINHVFNLASITFIDMLVYKSFVGKLIITLTFF
jgi:hypothetical protein